MWGVGTIASPGRGVALELSAKKNFRSAEKGPFQAAAAAAAATAAGTTTTTTLTQGRKRGLFGPKFGSKMEIFKSPQNSFTPIQDAVCGLEAAEKHVFAAHSVAAKL